MSDTMEQEIDLRPYMKAVIDKRYWILGFAVLGMLLGLGLSLIMNPTYEATALVAVTVPRERVEFDARIQTVVDNLPLQAYPDLAMSDQLLVELLQQLPDGHSLTLTDLRRMVSANSGADPSLVNLTVEYTDPAFAAEAANLWATLFVSWANQIYGYQGDEQLLFFEAQYDDARSQLEAAEEALTDFQGRNRSAILANELAAVQQTQADYLAKQRQTDLILQDIESLLAQEQGDAAAIDQLASVLLQVRALGGVPTNIESSAPWQLQLNLEALSAAAPTEQRAILLNLRDMLVTQGDQIEERLAGVEPEILAVQEEMQAAMVEEGRLQRDVEVAIETYTTLARTVDEKRITSQDTTSGVKLASRTAVPERPSSPNVILNALIAGVAGLVLATLAVIALHWWRTERDAAEDAPTGAAPARGDSGLETATRT